MRHRSHGILSLFAGVALAAAGCAQDSRPQPVPADRAPEVRPQSVAASRPAQSADELLAALDARLYVARDQGLKSLRFRYCPKSDGVLESAPFWVAVAWRAGGEAEVSFVGADGKPLAELPPLLRQPARAKDQPSYRDNMEQGAKAYVRMFVGRSYTDSFTGWHRRVEERVVNGRDERTIVLEPSRAGKFRRVEFALDPRGIPWRITNWESRATAADSVVQMPVFEEFTVGPVPGASRPAGAEPVKRLVMSSWKETRGEITDQLVISYQRVDGFLVPASHERISKAAVGNSKTVFEDVVVNK